MRCRRFTADRAGASENSPLQESENSTRWRVLFLYVRRPEPGSPTASGHPRQGRHRIHAKTPRGTARHWRSVHRRAGPSHLPQCFSPSPRIPCWRLFRAASAPSAGPPNTPFLTKRFPGCYYGCPDGKSGRKKKGAPRDDRVLEEVAGAVPVAARCRVARAKIPPFRKVKIHPFGASVFCPWKVQGRPRKE